MSIYIAVVHVDLTVVDKLNRKHSVTRAEVQEALQWPARVEAGYEDHPVHGGRWVVVGTVVGGREIIASLLPAPYWAGDRAEDWVVKTARWL